MRSRRRTLHAILCHPRTDNEERQADQHIRLETARIRAGWSEAEHRVRAGLSRRRPRWRPPTVADEILEQDADE